MGTARTAGATATTATTGGGDVRIGTVHPDIQKARDLLFDAVRDLAAEQADRAAAGKWSVAGIVEHLSLSYSKSAAGMARRREKGPGALARPRTLRQRVQQFVVVTLGYLPEGRKSPAAVVPTGRPYREVVADLDGVFRELDASLTAAGHALGGSRAVLDHPILGPFSVDQWRRFHMVHTRHHAKQIRTRRQGSS
jgi:hypothetical protein